PGRHARGASTWRARAYHTRRAGRLHPAPAGAILRSLRDRTCIAGVGETEYRPWGGITDRSEFQLACEAVLAACADAGLSPRALDGFASYANDRNDAPRLAAALGCAELRFSGMVWDGGGGGVCAAVAHAAAAIHAGAASAVAVVRALCQGEYGRFGRV